MKTTIPIQDASVEKGHDYWYQHFQQFQQGHLSKTAYSKQHDLVNHQFMYWSRKFERSFRQENKDNKNDFVAVKMKPVLGLQPAPLCSLEIDIHHKLHIHDLSALKVVLNWLCPRS